MSMRMLRYISRRNCRSFRLIKSAFITELKSNNQNGRVAEGGFPLGKMIGKFRREIHLSMRICICC